jgi:hypothetical protein
MAGTKLHADKGVHILAKGRGEESVGILSLGMFGTMEMK